jgi:alpha,alpha-trehalase
MSAEGERLQSAAAPSPPAPLAPIAPIAPIADYAFSRNCHTDALVAPDSSIRLAVRPGFDGPSIFGSLLDRQAGSFRRGPFGITVPTPGSTSRSNMLASTWTTPSGWALVRDAVTMSPRHSEDVITPHTRPPSDQDADHMLVWTVVCLEGNVEIEMVCEPRVDQQSS